MTRMDADIASLRADRWSAHEVTYLPDQADHMPCPPRADARPDESQHGKGQP